MSDVPLPALTPLQAKTYEWVKKFIEENHFSPTLREVQGGLGLASSNQARKLLGYLKTKGYITAELRKARTIRILR